jgi:hypothetical protein
VQVEKSNRLAYTPEILQIFQDLAEACREVGLHLKAQKDALENKRSPEIGLLNLRRNTAAGIFVANLSAKTDPQDIDRLCDVTDAERRRRDSLARALQDNPTHQADLLDSRARRLKGLVDLTINMQEKLSATVLQRFEAEFSEAAEAAEAAQAAGQVFAANSALDGLRTEAWRQLWESARRYSEELAYPTEPFPVTREDALCVLCQHPIAKTAAERLRSFEQFVQNDVQQRAEKALAKIQARKTELEALDIPISGTLLRETGLWGTPVGRTVKALLWSGNVGVAMCSVRQTDTLQADLASFRLDLISPSSGRLSLRISNASVMLPELMTAGPWRRSLWSSMTASNSSPLEMCYVVNGKGSYLSVSLTSPETIATRAA